MGNRGPAGLRLAEGIEDVSEASPPTSVPECPGPLEKSGMDEWRRITSLLQDAEMIAEIDMASVYVYCLTWQDLVKYETALQDEPLVLESKTGSRYQNPLIGMKNATIVRIRNAINDICASYAARTRLKVEIAKTKTDALEDLLNKWKKRGVG